MEARIGKGEGMELSHFSKHSDAVAAEHFVK